jgi:hypothetical protein
MVAELGSDVVLAVPMLSRVREIKLAAARRKQAKAAEEWA